MSSLWLFFFPRAGDASSFSGYRSSHYVGNEGRYWSSTVRDSDRAYRLLFSVTNVTPSDSDNRYIGHSVRCLVN